jgi:hypothetical protein
MALSALALTALTAAGCTKAPPALAHRAAKASAAPVAVPSPAPAPGPAATPGPDAEARYLVRIHQLAPSFSKDAGDDILLLGGHAMCTTADMPGTDLAGADYRGEGESALMVLAAAETLCPVHLAAAKDALAKGYK